MKLASLMTARNKGIATVLLVVFVVLFIYYAGKRAGRQCSWLDQLLGRCADPEKPIREYIATGPGAPWKPDGITNKLYLELDNHRFFRPNGEEINRAFEIFNNLNDAQKIAVVNDWAARIQGRDRPGWGTGDYDTLRGELDRFAGDFQPQVEIAYNWLNSNGF